ncbi:MAG: flagellar biosynthesis protein FlhG [Clostridia bacterium]|nr:flagellar biosynthesis protein FlhG [Clostridia bacterium]
MAKKHLFFPGQKILLKPHSQLYKGTYEVTVHEITRNSLRVTMPYDNGRIVLLAVGTEVEIKGANTVFQSKIVDKEHSENSTLTIAIPECVRESQHQNNTGPKIIAVTSGKGGVGKTNFVINVAIALAKKGLRTFIIDADLGTANVDVLLNIHPKYTLQDLVEGTKDNILDIIVEGPEGIQIVPGSSGFQSLADLSENELSNVIKKFEPLQEYADVIIIDTGAGLSRNVIKFVLAADEVIVITTTEPHAITDAYAIIKVLDDKDSTLNTKLIVNRVDSKNEAVKIIKRMESVVERFLNIKVTGLGYIFEDPNIRKAVKNYTPFIKYSPHSLAAKCITGLADKINPLNKQTDNISNKSFLAKLKKIFS